MDLTPIHFLDQPIDILFDTPPTREKAPDCPNGFIWEAKTYRVIEMLSSWTDFKRRGRMAQNMRPAHAAVASTRGSLNVGRYYFRVLVSSSSATAGRTEGATAGQGEAGRPESSSSTAGRTEAEEQIFDIYYDRAMKNVDDRKGQWFVYRELRSAA